MTFKRFSLMSLCVPLLSGIVLALIVPPKIAIAQNHSGTVPKISMVPDADMIRILSTLKQYDFSVSFMRPPTSKAYGLMQPSTKKIWIHPITYPLGIAKQTLIHEAVHAAQTCQSPSIPIIPIGIDIPISSLAHRHFMRYHDHRRQVEAEAFTVQGLSNGADYVIQLLHNHC